jgi:hypothetical protein
MQELLRERRGASIRDGWFVGKKEIRREGNQQ